MTPDKPLISVVAPVMNEQEVLPLFLAELRRVCDFLPYRFEFLLVDDGSTDDTPAVLAQLREDDERVRYVRLSRNFGHQAAVSAGLAHAAGDAVVIMDSDLQHPPAMIPELLKLYATGYEVVNTERQQSVGPGWVKRTASVGFYKVFNAVAAVPIQANGADFRLLARPVVDAINALPEKRRFFRGLVPWVGFKQVTVPFSAAARAAGRPKFTFTRSLRMGLEGLTAFSFFPLRRVGAFGVIVAALSFLYAIAAIIIHMTGVTVPGWTSLLVCVLFLGGVQLITLGVMGEYVGRILEEVKGRPGWIAREVVGDPPARAATMRKAG